MKKTSVTLISSEILKTTRALLPEIRSLIESVRNQAVAAANLSMVSLYWNIGRIIHAEVEKESGRSNYGDQLIEKLSETLTIEYGRGFSTPNLWDMKRFFTAFKILQTVSRELNVRETLPALRQKSSLNELFAIQWSLA